MSDYQMKLFLCVFTVAETAGVLAIAAALWLR